MKFTKLFTIALCASLLLGSCDDDDDNISVPPIVENSFSTQFPQATNVSWEMETQYAQTYIKAEFKLNGIEKEAWYTAAGAWVKTATDFTGPLPQVISDYIRVNYADFHIDDIHWVETPEHNFYEIELERGKEEIDLCIQEDGTVISALPHTH